jgi:hypothetical protein
MTALRELAERLDAEFTSSVDGIDTWARRTGSGR